MPSLLDIPRELRDGIINLVLASSRRPPDGPESVPECRTTKAIKSGAESNPFTSNSLPLLLVNRQLSSETQSALNRLYQRPSFHLDVMFVNESELWPTWLHVPTLSRSIDEINVDFRIVSGTVPGARSLFRGGDGGPPQIVWLFYDLLKCFLESGPALKSNPKDQVVTIRKLNLHFPTPTDTSTLPPEEMTMSEWLRARRYPKRATLPNFHNYFMRPEWLADFLMSHMSALIHVTDGYGAIMYERVGSIHVFVNGEPSEKFDLGAILPFLKFDNRRGRYWEGMCEWQKEAIALRREADLPVILPPPKESAEVETS